MAEIGLAILVIGALIAVDRQRLAWAAGKVRDLIEWLTT